MVYDKYVTYFQGKYFCLLCCDCLVPCPDIFESTDFIISLLLRNYLFVYFCLPG